jgi:hypothetical protein
MSKAAYCAGPVLLERGEGRMPRTLTVWSEPTCFPVHFVTTKRNYWETHFAPHPPRLPLEIAMLEKHAAGPLKFLWLPKSGSPIKSKVFQQLRKHSETHCHLKRDYIRLEVHQKASFSNIHAVTWCLQTYKQYLNEDQQNKSLLCKICFFGLLNAVLFTIFGMVITIWNWKCLLETWATTTAIEVVQIFLPS